MVRTRPQIFIVIIAAFIVVFGTLFVWNARTNAADEPVDWFTKTPTFSKVADLPAIPVISNRDCATLSIQVARNYLKPAESHCFVPTIFGLLNTNGDILYRDIGHPVKNSVGGNPALVAVPNQGAVMTMHGTGTGGVYYGLYRNFFSKLTPSLLFNGEQRYTFVDPTDQYYRYISGDPIVFSSSTSLGFSTNGRYFIANAGLNGIVKSDMLNLGMRTIAAATPKNHLGLYSSTANAIDNEGRFAATAYNGAGQNKETHYFKIVDTSSCTGGALEGSGRQPEFSCTTKDLFRAADQAIPNLWEIYNVRFTNERTVRFVAGTKKSDGSSSYAAYTMTAGGQQERRVSYLAMGDSYISGEGAGAYSLGTDNERNRCHQSAFAYPKLLSGIFNLSESIACSGARQFNITEPVPKDFNFYQIYGDPPNIQEINSARNSYEPGFVLQKDFVTEDNPEAITISIGGNDIGFSDIITKCTHPLKGLSTGAAHHTCYSTYEDRVEVVNLINERLPQLSKLYADLRNNGAEVRRVYVIGYPQVAKVGGDCGLNVAMDAHEVQFAYDLIAYFNRVIKQAADEAGVVYVDTQQAFDGRRLCEGDGSQSAMNGITVRRQPWGGFGVVESFHPNQAGHRLLADTIAAQTDGLKRPMPAPVAASPAPVVDPNMPLLSYVERANRSIYKLKMLERGEAVVKKGSQLDMVVNARDYDIKPGGVYQVTMRSDPISMGSFTAGADGTLRVNATVPASAEAGFHTIHIQGTDTFNQLIDLQQVVYVAAGDEDYDGDAVPNDIDSCGLVAQSGVDRDLDEVDDACDPLIGAAPDTSGGPQGIIWRDDAVLAIEIQAHSGP